MSFKAPKYRRFLDPWKINVYAYPVLPISDREFRTALREAHWLMSLAIDQATAARMRRQSRVGVAGSTSRAEIKAAELVVRRRDELLWLLAGLLELHLPGDNAAAQKKAKELVKAARKRSQDSARAARLQPKEQISSTGFRVPFSRKNAAKRKR
jgi:hypothetical protein